MTPEQAEHITTELAASLLVGAFALCALIIFAVGVLDKLDAILERLGPKP